MNTESGQRVRATKLAKSRPDEAFKVASGIADAWHRVQALAWVARFAPPDISRKALQRAAGSALEGKDSYCRAAALAWPIRAAIELGHEELAAPMLAGARIVLPHIELFCSRAEACSLLFQASFEGPRHLWEPLLTELPALCPPGSHWRAARLYRTIGAILADRDSHAARLFIESIPPGKARSRCLRDLENGVKRPPRPFFW
jgi:hypothetical protein